MASTELLTPRQQKMVETREKQLECEYVTKSAEGSLSTFHDHNAYIYLVPSGVGGANNGVGGTEAILEGMNRMTSLSDLFSKTFIPQNPPDMEVVQLSRTIGHSQIVDEALLKFTHSVQMDWLLPGVPPTNKRIEVPLVGIAKFEGDKMKSEHIYWDQASVLVQVGLMERGNLPVVGVETAHQLLNFHNSSRG